MTSADVARRCVPVDDPQAAAVSVAVHHPAGGGGPDDGRVQVSSVLLVPGAGADLDDEGLTALAALLADLGHPTVRANLPFREAGRRGAPRAERSVDAYAQVLAAVDALLDTPGPWIVGGRSYGGRVASLLVADPPAIDLPALTGLLCLSYPLHPAGRPDRLRVAHWPRLHLPTLLVQGTRDALCTLSLLEAQLPLLPGPLRVHHVPGADHALRVTAAASPDGRVSRPSRTVAGLRPVLASWLGDVDADHASGRPCHVPRARNRARVVDRTTAPSRRPAVHG